MVILILMFMKMHFFDNFETFEKSDRAPPPQSHLESSRGEVKDRFAARELKLDFGGRKLKDLRL